MREEEKWKTFLNWGVVIMFLSMPIVVMLIQLAALHWPTFLSQELPQAEFKHLVEFQRALAFLVFGLSGLRTWEVVKEKNGNKKERNNVGTSN